MVAAPHPQSVIQTVRGREVQLKVHKCVWSGDHPGNSLAAILECYQARVARAEVDIAMLRDQDFLLVHDLNLANATDGEGLVEETSPADARRLHLADHGAVSGAHPPLLTEVAEAIAAAAYPTLLELDLKDWKPWPWPRVEELARILHPIRDRVTFGGGADWNLRRLHRVDPELRLGFTINDYLDWRPVEQEHRPRGAYGYVDSHPLARQRLGPTADYLHDRLGAILRLVPNVCEVHIRLVAAERMVQDGVTDLAELLHSQGMLLDLWTLNAGKPGWQEGLSRALEIGADVITTETPRQLALAVAP